MAASIATATRLSLDPNALAPQAQWAAGTARWQPGWHARQKWLAKLQHGQSLKKKSAVALARQLAIDLWRWRTGRATAAELGWTLKPGALETGTA